MARHLTDDGELPLECGLVTTIEAAGLIARCLVAVAFILAASMKSSAFSRWRLVVRDYRLIPEVLVFPAAAGVIVAELALGVALLVNPNAPAASLGAGVLLSVFTFALIARLARGKAQSDCGCLGKSDRGLRRQSCGMSVSVPYW